MKSGYTLITTKSEGAPIDEIAVEELRETFKLRANRDMRFKDGRVVGITVPTKSLKQKIKSDEALREVISRFGLLLCDILPPKALRLGKVRVSIPISGEFYVKATRNDEKTAYVDDRESIDDSRRRLERVAAWIPAGILAGMAGGVVYMAGSLARTGVRIMEQQADLNNQMTDIDHGKRRDGLDAAIRVREGKPADPDSPLSWEASEALRREIDGNENASPRR